MAFDRPYAAALAVALLFASSPISVVPSALRSLFVVLALVPELRLTRSVFDPRLVPSIYALAGLFMLDTVRQTFGGVGKIEQVILAAEMLTGIAVLAYSLTRGELRPRAGEARETEQLRGFRAGAILLILVFTTALVAGTVGYMRLARLLGAGVLGSVALAVSFFAIVRVATALVAFTLRVWPLRLLRMVQHHRRFPGTPGHPPADLDGGRRLGGASLWRTSVSCSRPSRRAARCCPRSWVGAPSPSRWATCWSSSSPSGWRTCSRPSSASCCRRTCTRARGVTRGMSYALSSLLNYIILTLGFLLAIGAVGIDLTKMTVLAGAFGVGLGFGMQSIVNNFVSGLILLFERPIHVGDIIEVGDLTGEVSRIGIRASMVRTYLGAEIIVPNAQLTTERVINWTLSDRRRRIDLAVGVDYGSPPERVVEVLESVARNHPAILKDPVPQAVFIKFDDSSINFELRAWTSQFEGWPKVQTELAAGVYAALHAAGMSLPFPQREVRILHDGVAPGPTIPATRAEATPRRTPS